MFSEHQYCLSIAFVKESTVVLALFLVQEISVWLQLLFRKTMDAVGVYNVLKKAMSVAAVLVKTAMLLAASLVQQSYVACCRSCSAKLCCLLQVLFRKAILLAAGLVQVKLCCLLQVFLRKAILFVAGLVQESYVCCRSCSGNLY